MLLSTAASTCRSLPLRCLTRGLATRRKVKTGVLSPELLNSMPAYTEDAVEEPEKSPQALPRAPVTSVHCIDVAKQQVSMTDSAAISPNGTIVHGKFGELPAAATEAIPLEYLALLGPAAEGCAALRVLVEKSKTKTGTVLVYGAGQPNAFATAQVASAAGHAVVAVVGSEHSGNEDFMECVKGLIAEPGTAVPEEYALSKKLFAELVEGISTGSDGIETHSPEEYLKDFKQNFLDYVQAFPDTRPAAVPEEELKFEYMEKDREFWEENMRAYLEQYPPGAPPVDKAKLDAFFSTEQYEIFRAKFWHQTTGVISGDDAPFFSPPHIVKQLSEAPETLEHKTYPGAGGADVPYSFSVINQYFPQGTEPKAGGPILGAVIAVTPDLQIAAEKVAAAKKLRQKGEALQFMTKTQKAAFQAACSVAAQARKANAPITVVGGTLPGMDTVKVTDADVKEALAAMDIDDNGETRLNYFVQVYRGADFSFYADYAIHRASEELAGPRQILVTK